MWFLCIYKRFIVFKYRYLKFVFLFVCGRELCISIILLLGVWFLRGRGWFRFRLI